MGRISKRLVSSGALDVVADGHPRDPGHPRPGQGQAARARRGIADLILVDAPATGHAMTFLSSAQRPPRRRPVAVPSGPRPPTSSNCYPIPTLPGGPRHPARGDAGQRGHRGRLPARGPGRHALGPVIVNACLPDDPELAEDPAAAAAAAAGVTLTRGSGGGTDAPPRSSGSAARASRTSSGTGWPTSSPSPSCGRPSSSATPSARRSSIRLRRRPGGGRRGLPSRAAGTTTTASGAAT